MSSSVEHGATFAGVDAPSSLIDDTWLCMGLTVVWTPQPPNTPVSIKTGPTLAISKAEAGPNADGCIAPGSVWFPSGVRVACLGSWGVLLGAGKRRGRGPG